jgi:prepilin-type N-terminal cleavage/methylation domain-containing protein
MKKGLTLIEILVAVSITAIIVLSLYGALVYGMAINLKTKHKAIAYHAASQEMEILRNTPFSTLTNQTDGPFIGEVDDLDKLPSSLGKLTIENYGGSSDIKKVTIKVIWQEKGGQKEVQLVTLISKGGLNP